MTAEVLNWRMARVLLVGQAPGRSGPPPGRALVGGASGTFLQKIAGFQGDLKGYLKHFETTNLLDKYPGRAAGAKGDLFPKDEARRRAEQIEPTFRGRRVIFVGYNVAHAFGHDLSIFQWFSWLAPDLAYRYAVIPHPSKVNHFWNDKANVRRAVRFFDETFGRWPVGD